MPVQAMKIALTVFTALLAMPAAAQNLGGVFGPVVNSDDRSAQLRTALVPADEGADARFAARVHYQHALSDRLRLRGVVAGADPGDGFDLAVLQAEIVYQLTGDDSAPFQSAVRLDGFVGLDGRPEGINLNVTADQRLTDTLAVRGVILLTDQFGSGSSGGIFVQTRAHVRYRLQGGVSLAAELYNFHDKLGRGGGRDRHQLGPVANFPLTDDIGMSAGWLFGLDKGSPDDDLRLWLSMGF